PLVRGISFREEIGAEAMSPKKATDESKLLHHVLGRALSGKGAHAAAAGVFCGIDVETARARPSGLPHSLHQILGHIVFWQDWAVEWLDGENPRIPKHASGSWPNSAEPDSAAEWERCVRHFQNSLKELERRTEEMDLLVRQGKQSRLEILHAIASHNSY